MSQNLVSLSLTNDQIAAIDHSIGELENQLQGLVSLSIDSRRTAAKMGPKSEAFCRQTINALRLYPQVVPPSVGVDDAHSDLDTLDQLRPLFQRVHRPVAAFRGYRARARQRRDGHSPARLPRAQGGRAQSGARFAEPPARRESLQPQECAPDSDGRATCRRLTQRFPVTSPSPGNGAFSLPASGNAHSTPTGAHATPSRAHATICEALVSLSHSVVSISHASASCSRVCVTI